MECCNRKSVFNRLHDISLGGKLLQQLFYYSDANDCPLHCAIRLSFETTLEKFRLIITFKEFASALTPKDFKTQSLSLTKILFEQKILEKKFRDKKAAKKFFFL